VLSQRVCFSRFESIHVPLADLSSSHVHSLSNEPISFVIFVLFLCNFLAVFHWVFLQKLFLSVRCRVNRSLFFFFFFFFFGCWVRKLRGDDQWGQLGFGVLRIRFYDSGPKEGERISKTVQIFLGSKIELTSSYCIVCIHEESCFRVC